MKANLLMSNESLCISKDTIAQTVINIRNLQELKKKTGDEIFKSSDIQYVIKFIDGKNIYKSNQLPSHLNYLSRDIVALELFARVGTVTKSKDLKSLETEFKKGNNGLTGFDFTKIKNIPKEKCVYDEDSWYNFHRNYFIQNSSDTSYFPQNTIIPKDKKNQKSEKKTINTHYTPFIEFALKKLTYRKKIIDIKSILNFSSENEKDRKKILTDLNILQNEKQSFYKELGKQIAEKNFYKKSDNKLDKHNDALRKSGKLKTNKKTPYFIYERGDGKNKIYLSLDFEKGTFEVCNHNGDHQGELFFNGKFDDSPHEDHKIEIL